MSEPVSNVPRPRVRRPVSRLLRGGDTPQVRQWPGGHEYQGGSTRRIKAAALLVALLRPRRP